VELSEFYRDWFGLHGGREILLTYDNDRRDRLFIRSAEELEDYVNLCRVMKAPAYVSVQPFQERDRPLGLEKLFFEFDCEADPKKAWEDAKRLSEAIMEFYEAVPFLKFSGRKGYHLDLFLRQTVAFDLRIHPLPFVKAVYSKLQEKLLLGLKLPTLDRQVLGDIKRLERVPYSLHEKSGKTCQPITFEGEPIPPEKCSLEDYRESGLPISLLRQVIHEVANEEKWRNLFRKRLEKYGWKPKNAGEIRPCIREALNKPLEGENGHLMRLAVACEFLNKGYSVDQIVDLFRSQRDFSEQKTRYYVEDAKKKAYKPFKCETIRKLGFCLGSSCPIFSKKRKERIVIGEA